MSDNFHIRRATSEDATAIIGMLDEAGAFLATKSTDQWRRPWPSRIARDARIQRGIQDRHTWIAEDQGEPVATITYKKYGNQDLWTARELRDPAVYACRLVVRRKWAGNQIGAALIDWAGYRALQAWKAQWIRIDVWTTNIALHRYYEKQGFRPVRIPESDDSRSRPSAAMFQKPTEEVNEVAATRFTEIIGRTITPGGTSRQSVLAEPTVSVGPAVHLSAKHVRVAP